MGTRKYHRKSNKIFRRTRSKKQRGGGKTSSSNKRKYEEMDNDTALIDASKNGDIEIVVMLLDAGADVNAKDKWGITALIKASKNGHTEIVSKLLDAGADVNAKSNNGYTALYEASNNEHTEIVAMLLRMKGIIVDAKNNGDTALIRASYKGHTKIVAMLLEKGADVNAKGNGGWTALDYAIEEEHPEIMKLLIRNGATIPDDREDLLKIKEEVEREVARKALTGVAIRLANTIPTTNEEYVTRQVLGQSVNTPKGIIRPLTEKIKGYLGGKRKTRSKRQRGGGNTSSSTKRKHEDDDMDLIEASRNRHTEIVAMLLEKGADVNATDDYGDTALMKVINCNEEDDRPWYQVEYDIIEIVEMLLAAGAVVNVVNDSDMTALDIAEKTGCTKQIKKLIIKHNIASTIPKVLERQEDRKNLAMVMSEKDVGNRGDGTMPYELRHEIGKYLGGGKRKTRRSKKPNKRFRKTRSKRQRGGVITRSRKDTSKAKKSTRKTKNKPSKKPSHTEENNELCPICLEIIDNNTDNVTTNCNHTYHRQCLIELCEGKRNNAICPICRENIRDICDLINLHPIMDENINANDGINLLDELNAEVENEDDREIYTIFEDDDFIEERNRILNEGNIGDIIEYISNGQLNMRYYEINLDEGGNKYFKEVGNMYGFYNNPEHPDYDLYNIEGGKRKTRKTRRK